MIYLIFGIIVAQLYLAFKIGTLEAKVDELRKKIN